jgi:methylenetetrahydrofolate dehydrogenase (NADP+)/methenyltetrahydrofolate cyclohydrolase
MHVDGKAIAQKLQDTLREEIEGLSKELVLSVVALSSNSATEQFVSVKQKLGEQLGVRVDVVRPDADSTEMLVTQIEGVVGHSDGVIIQLPVPEVFDLERLLDAVPPTHDVDVLGSSARELFAAGTSPVVPPVVAGMGEILREHDIDPKGKCVVVVGEGRLVGGPAMTWFWQQGAFVEVVNRTTENLTELTKHADIIVLGAGSPGLLQPNMVRDGVVVLDAGSGEVSGRVAGDANPAVAKNAALFTPTPGGVGPVAVTMIFANLLALWKQNKK